MTQQASVKFLLVDDLEENLLALEGILRRKGLELLKARSGPEALELLLVHEIALALMDVQMPGMDGFELAELMRGTERTRRVPIIFLTAGIADQQRRFRGYDAGAVDFLTKPIEPHVLRSKADVFFDLWLERHEVARQRDVLHAATAENARLLEETRRTALELKEADRRKDEFLATLAHELRNPLAPLANGLKLMQLAAGDANTIGRARDMMERQLAHLVRLVDDLLDVSRVSTGKIRLRLDQIDLRTAVEAAIEATKPSIESGGHRLTVQLPKAPLWVKADETRAAQIVGNLLTNAGKYTPSGGDIFLSLEEFDGCACIKVRDTGIGIPQEMLPRIFDLFTQIGGELDRSQGGLGIGLALVKRLVGLHGGSVEAESPGRDQGSTFTVRIPLAVHTEKPAPHCPFTPETELRHCKFLIVDDNADGAESLALLLRLDGHDTRVAHSGPEALSAAEELKPDAVFLDIGLPGMNGFEVAAALRERPFGRSATLVAVTGWGSAEDRRRTHEAGFDFHLTKPVEAQQLQAVIEKLGEKSQER
ncbi:MAG: response regulator [Bdellovibrionota bacterium]